VGSAISVFGEGGYCRERKIRLSGVLKKNDTNVKCGRK
jgi:hypothetical protein